MPVLRALGFGKKKSMFESNERKSMERKLNQRQESYNKSGASLSFKKMKEKLKHTASFSFKKMKEKLKHAFGVTRNLNSVEGVTSKRSRKTLEQFLSSPEHDTSCKVAESSSQIRNGRKTLGQFLSSPEHDTSCKVAESSSQIRNGRKTLGQFLSSPEHDFLPHDTSCKVAESSSQIRNGTERACPSPLRSNTEVTWCDVHNKCDSILQMTDAKTCSLIPITENEAHDTEISAAAQQQLQPLRLDFDQDRSFESFSQDPSISSNSSMEEEDHLSRYVQLVLQASGLNWDRLSEIRPQPEQPQPEQLLDISLFYEVGLPPSDCYYDPKLLFDHINEILLQIYESHFCYPLEKRKIGSTTRPLAELVLDEIMREADFYLLPTTEERTLDQHAVKDVAKCGSCLMFDSIQNRF